MRIEAQGGMLLGHMVPRALFDDVRRLGRSGDGSVVLENNGNFVCDADLTAALKRYREIGGRRPREVLHVRLIASGLGSLTRGDWYGLGLLGNRAAVFAIR